MTVGATTNKDKDKAARELATAHFEVDPAIQRIFRLLPAAAERERDDAEPIKLLEVNADTVAAGIQPVYFGPDVSHGLLFASVIVEVRPEEYEALRKGTLTLPHGWRIAEEYRRPSGG